MRGTGSHQVRIAGFFCCRRRDRRTSAARTVASAVHLVFMIAIPIIYSVYYGIAEALRDAAIASARRRPVTPALIQLAGALDTERAAARFALADMLAASGGQPGPETTNRVFLGRTNLVRALLATTERSLDIAQGSGFMRSEPIERLFRDIQVARFHPLQPHAQDIAGRKSFGLEPDGPAA